MGFSSRVHCLLHELSPLSAEEAAQQGHPTRYYDSALRRPLFHKAAPGNEATLQERRESQAAPSKSSSSERRQSSTVADSQFGSSTATMGFSVPAYHL